jgi:hypothetical protein
MIDTIRFYPVSTREIQISESVCVVLLDVIVSSRFEIAVVAFDCSVELCVYEWYLWPLWWDVFQWGLFPPIAGWRDPYRTIAHPMYSLPSVA